MKWKITYKESVKKDLKKISKDMQYILRRAIEEKLMIDPVKFGLPLRKSLKSYMKLRVDYRIIYSISENTIIVHVIKIGHRRDIYKKI